MKYRVRNKSTMNFVSIATTYSQAQHLCDKLNLCSTDTSYEVVPMNADTLGISKDKRTMNDDEKLAIKHLKNVTMVSASEHKRFVRTILAALIDGLEITERQAAYLWYLVFHYRRQINNKDLIALAEKNKLY